MKEKALKLLGRAAGERMTGSKPGVMTALVAAAIIGTAAGVVTYKALRAGG